MLTELTLITP